MTRFLQTSMLAALLVIPIKGFVATSITNGHLSTRFQAAARDDATTTTDDLLSPSYEISPLSIRIGHGFDIHRMVPLEEAGQPVVIAVVEITHTDQKVRLKNPMTKDGDYVALKWTAVLLVDELFFYILEHLSLHGVDLQRLDAVR